MNCKQRINDLFFFTICILFCLIFLQEIVRPKTIFSRNVSVFQSFKLSFAANTLAESAASCPNPDRGYYHIYGYVLNDEASFTPQPIAPEDFSEKLVLLEINLREYRDRPLTDKALYQLDHILSQYAALDKHLLLRFLYDWDGTAYLTEPEDIQILLTHMEQTAQVYNDYCDEILTLQGLFFGNCGEMHSSAYADRESILLLGEKLLSVTDPSIFLSVRTPHQWRILTGTDSFDTLEDPASNPYYGRLGLFNDGMLGSASDLGTYTDHSREDELLFQTKLCTLVPNGGEVTQNNPLNDLENAIKDLSAMKISYLNSQHERSVLSKWKDTVYHAADCYDGMSGFDYIGLHLGYRYYLSDCTFTPASGSSADLALRINNSGFAPNYSPLNFYVSAIPLDDTADTAELFRIPLPISEKDLDSGVSCNVTLPLNLSKLPSGNYSLCFSVSEAASGRTIFLANELPFANGSYELGTFSLHHLVRSIPRRTCP